ncbi:M16 family metallopeptidase [Melioribacter sp. OK-6-Me]|uniref:M16 family metallopeptidase n=1 Tax=unclassified Melioribacter TaxID=2627329 RepID=UPI003EDAE068
MSGNIFNINYSKHFLQNGLEIILFQDRTVPTVSVNIWYKVGSANEVPGKTGFAHLFEHMMFQGSKHVPKEGHFKFIEEAGGSLNGSTSFDRTNYYETVPANYLELALWLESDRMGFLLDALNQEKLDNQKEVVMNERRQRYENQPYGLAWELIFSNLFPPDHPYSWPTIGWMKDIENFSLDDVKDFFKKYYKPSNATLAVGGNFEKEEAIDLIVKYFGEIPGGAKPELPVSEQISLSKTKKVVHPDNIELPRIYLAWHSDKIFGDDDASLDILADVLSSAKSSRLQKSLVFEKQIAQDVNAFQFSARLAGVFIIVATAKPGVSTNELKEEIFRQIDQLIKSGITLEELDRAKNSIKSHYVYSLQKIDNIVDQLNLYNYHLGEPNSFEYDLERYSNVSSSKVQQTANKYLSNDYVELHIVPKEGGLNV